MTSSQHEQLIQFCAAEFEHEYKFFLGGGGGGGPATAISVEPLYIEARGSTTEHESNSFSLINLLLAELNQDNNINNPPPIYSYVILGPSGSGKSSLALQLTKCTWDQFNSGQSEVIPIYISLPKMCKQLDDILYKYFEGAAGAGSIKPHVTEFCRNHKLLLILDSYDEIHGENPSNLWSLNDWGGTNYRQLKMITFSRPEVFSSIAELKFKFDAVLNKGAGAAFNAHAQDSTKLHQVFYMQQYTKEDIAEYIARFSKFLGQLANANSKNLKGDRDRDYDYDYWSSILSVIEGLGWEDVAVEYKSWFKTLSDLKELGSNPYLLTLILQSLPAMIQKYANNTERLKAICSTKAGVYDEFTHHWFSYQVKRTQAKFRLPTKLAAAGLGIDHASLLGYFYAYAQNLAGALIHPGTGLLTDQPITMQDSLVWHLAEPYRNDALLGLYKTDKVHKSLFPTPSCKDENEVERRRRNLTLLRNGSLIRFHSSSNEFRFFHRSLVEYFAARQLFETLHSQYDTIIQGIEGCQESDTTDTGLNRQLIKDKGVLAQLIDRVKSDVSFSELLGEIILSSAQILILGVMSSNAITILNLAGISFSAQDFRNVQVVGADLSGAILGNTDLRGANLEGSRLQNSYLAAARLQGANLKNVDIGQKPIIVLRSVVQYILPFINSKGQSCLWIAGYDGRLSLWRLDNLGKVLEIKHKFNPVSDENCVYADNLELHRVSDQYFVSHSKCCPEVFIWDVESGSKLGSFTKHDFIRPGTEEQSRISMSTSIRNELIGLYIRDSKHDVVVLKLIPHAGASMRRRRHYVDVVPHFTIKTRPEFSELRYASFNPVHKGQLLLLYVKRIRSSGGEGDEIKIFDLEIHDVLDQNKPMLINTLKIHESHKRLEKPFVVHPSGNYFVVNFYKGLHTYNNLGVIIHSMCPRTVIHDVVFSCNGGFLLTFHAEGFEIWSFPDFQPIQKGYGFAYSGLDYFPIAFTLSDGWIVYGIEKEVHLLKVTDSISSNSGKNRPIHNINNPGSGIHHVYASPNCKHMVLGHATENWSRIGSMEGGGGGGGKSLVDFNAPTGRNFLDLVWVTNNVILIVGKFELCLSRINEEDYSNYISDRLKPQCLYEARAGLDNASINHAQRLIVGAFAYRAESRYFQKVIAYSYSLKQGGNEEELLFEPSQSKLIYTFNLNDVPTIYDMKLHCKRAWLVTSQWLYTIPTEKAETHLQLHVQNMSMFGHNASFVLMGDDNLVTYLAGFFSRWDLTQIVQEHKADKSLKPPTEPLVQMTYSTDLLSQNVMCFVSSHNILACGNLECQFDILDASTLTKKLSLQLWFRIYNINCIKVDDSSNKNEIDLIIVGDNFNAIRFRLYRNTPQGGEYDWAILWSLQPSSKLVASSCQLTKSLLYQNTELRKLLEQCGAIGEPALAPVHYIPFCSLMREVPGTATESAVRPIVSSLKRFIISSDAWVISAIVKNEGKECGVDRTLAGHAFLVIEGILNNRWFAIRAELTVADDKKEVVIMITPLDDIERFKNSANEYSACQWSIAKGKGISLLQNIQEDQQRIIKYNLLKHNCASWCRDQLLKIGIDMNMKKHWYSSFVVTPRNLGVRKSK